MIDPRLFDELAALLNHELAGSCKRAEPLAHHTSFKIGGPAALFCVADSESDLRRVYQVAATHELPLTVLGRGTNILVSDEGYRGICLVLGPHFRTLDIDHETGRVTAGAGTLLARLVQESQRAALTGLEFATGIPGTLGGAIAGNAGSRDEWLSTRVRELTVFDAEVGLHRRCADDINFAYRTSDLRGKTLIVDGRLALEEGDAKVIARRIEGSLARRKMSQPLFSPSAGSVFKNPEGASAAQLIEATGMKGAIRGGAQVSEIHANFIINRDNAAAADVTSLIAEIRDKVDSKYGIELEPEIRFLGTFDKR